MVNRDVRCVHCNKLLAKHVITTCGLEIKCVRCGVLNTIAVTQGKQIMVIDTQGKVLYVNQFLCDETGYTAIELVGNNCSLFQRAGQDIDMVDVWESSPNKNQSFDLQAHVQKQNNIAYLAQINAFPVFGEVGTVALFLILETIIE